MTRLSLLLATIAFFGLCSAPEAGTTEVTVLLDGVANPRFLDTHFERYGYHAAKSIVREGTALHFRLPSGVKGGVGQTGLYSYVALHGEFEVSASYDWTSVQRPKEGYGASCGFALDTDSKAGSVSLARCDLPGKGKNRGNGYVVTRFVPSAQGPKYDNTHFPIQAKSGRLAIRREEKEIVCLVADVSPEFRELCRLPFSDGIIRKVRLYADPGNAPISMDVRISDVRVAAAAIKAGAPLKDEVPNYTWLWAIAFSVIVAASAVLVTRHRQEKWPFNTV